MKLGRYAWLAIALCVAVIGCDTETAPNETAAGDTTEPIRVAYVTNGIDPFWTIAEAGAKAGAEEFNVSCEVLMPPQGLGDQKRMVETLLSNGIDGIALSPIDAANQVGFINDACKRTLLLTHDSDAPESDRLVFIGMDNYKAGREAGKLVKEVMPDGGSIMIFVGRLEQLNAQQRRQGVIDELLGRPVPPPSDMKFDTNDFTSKDGKYIIEGTRTDDFNYQKAKQNAEDTIAGYANLGCMVGLFAYNTPNCLAAVREAGKTGAIKLVSFDEANDTLEGIKSGEVHGTVSQQPYLYGYHSVRVLAALARGDRSVIPENKFIEVESVIVRKDNVEEFAKKLAELKGE